MFLIKIKLAPKKQKKIYIHLEFLLNYFQKSDVTKSEMIYLLQLYDLICKEKKLLEYIDDNKRFNLNKQQKQYIKKQNQESNNNITKLTKEFENKFSEVYHRNNIMDTLDKIIKEDNKK